MKIIIILIILAISLYALHLRGELTYRLAEIRNLQNIIHEGVMILCQKFF